MILFILFRDDSFTRGLSNNRRFINKRSATNIRDWSLAYSFIVYHLCGLCLFRNHELRICVFFSNMPFWGKLCSIISENVKMFFKKCSRFQVKKMLLFSYRVFRKNCFFIIHCNLSLACYRYPFYGIQQGLQYDLKLVGYFPFRRGGGGLVTWRLTIVQRLQALLFNPTT